MNNVTCLEWRVTDLTSLRPRHKSRAENVEEFWESYLNKLVTQEEFSESSQEFIRGEYFVSIEYEPKDEDTQITIGHLYF